MASKSDTYALAIINEGLRRHIKPRGIIMALATALVETDMIMYANEKVRESYDYPHDRVGSDGWSVGLFQQQIRKSEGGRWWWADCATCMDPEKSAGLFYERLIKIDYEDGRIAAGWFCQYIQQSAYPHRYGERMDEASLLFERLTKEVPMTEYDYGITKVMHGYNPASIGIGNSNGPRASTAYGVVHTQEGKSTAVQLAQYCNANLVSYNLAIDDEDTVEIVPLNEAPWAAAEANDIAFHICFAGSFANWSEDRWLSTDVSDGLHEDAMLWRGAKAMAAACQEFGISVLYAGDGGRSGWPVKGSGIVGHRDFGQRGGGHSDPGDGFPMDEFIRRVDSIINKKEEAPTMGVADSEMSKKFPSRSAYRTTDVGIDTLAGFICNIDARIHELSVESAALNGNLSAIEQIKRVAENGIMGDLTGFDYPGLVEDTKARAQAVLDEIEETNP